jgi:hypothetical protein
MPPAPTNLAIRFCQPAVLVAALSALAALPAPGRADPAGEVLRLVPPETSICLVVRDLRTHVGTVRESPFAGWFKKSALGRRFGDPEELRKIEELERFLVDQFGVTGEQLIDDVLGDALVLAYQSGPPDRPEDEGGVLFTHARDPRLLARLADKLNEFQRKSGEIKEVRERVHRGRAYTEREKSDGGREFYLLRGGILAFSAQERMIRAVIDQDLTAPPASENPGRVAVGLRALGLADKFAACWFDPRGFDAELAAKAGATDDPGEKAFLSQFARVWAATDGVAVYAHPGRGLELGVAAGIDWRKLPKEVREFAHPSSGGTTLWPVVPDDAILAAGGRLDLPRLVAGVAEFLPPEGRTGLKSAIEQGLAPVVGRDKLPAVLAGLGPDWVVWVTPPAKGVGGWTPEWTAILKLSGGDVKGADVPRTVLQAVDFAAQMIRFGYNRDNDDQIELTDETRDGVTVRVLSNEARFPDGFRPSYALKQGHLVIASSPEGVHRFSVPAPGASADGLMLRFSARHLRGYLTEHRAGVAGAVARWSGKSAEDVGRELDELTAVLEAFDRVEVRHSTGDGYFRLTMRIEFVEPLSR